MILLLTFGPSKQRHKMSVTNNRVSFAGVLIALGIIYGDIGTSPLYVLNAIISGKQITEDLVIGSFR